MGLMLVLDFQYVVIHDERDGCHTSENCQHQVGVEPLLVKVTDHFLVILSSIGGVV